MIASGKIQDFYSTNEILDKLDWFHQFTYGERHALFNKANVSIYSPGEVIFRKGDSSPNIFLIIHGSVLATNSKKEWGPNVTMNVKMFKDGENFGEMSDYSPNDLRDLMGQGGDGD